jgi:hypothetical protein
MPYLSLQANEQEIAEQAIFKLAVIGGIPGFGGLLGVTLSVCISSTAASRKAIAFSDQRRCPLGDALGLGNSLAGTHPGLFLHRSTVLLPVLFEVFGLQTPVDSVCGCRRSMY